MFNVRKYPRITDVKYHIFQEFGSILVSDAIIKVTKRRPEYFDMTESQSKGLSADLGTKNKRNNVNPQGFRYSFSIKVLSPTILALFNGDRIIPPPTPSPGVQ